MQASFGGGAHQLYHAHFLTKNECGFKCMEFESLSTEGRGGITSFS